MSDKSYESGLKLFKEIYGEAAAASTQSVARNGQEFGAEQSRWTLEFAFGEIWTRPGLERKLRSCVVLGMLIASRQTEEIKYHTKMGLKNGLSRTELEEIFYTALPYAGFPAAQSAKRAMLEAFAELDAAQGGTTGKD